MIKPDAVAAKNSLSSGDRNLRRSVERYHKTKGEKT